MLTNGNSSFAIKVKRDLKFKGRSLYLYIILISLSFVVVFTITQMMQEIERVSVIVYYIHPKPKKVIPLRQFYLEDFTKIKENLLLNEKKFIEIDLEEMKARLYQDGEIAGELSVSTKGDPKSWNVTPSGLYWVITKNQLSFSTISKVFMPYSVKFHGKYYLHGQPYYPDGTPLYSQYSGGCVRFFDKDVKTIYNFAEKDMPILIIDKGFKNDYYEYPSEPATSFPELSAQSYLVGDLNNGFVLVERSFEEKFPINSLTKLMTAAVVVNHRYLNRTITASQEMIEPFEPYIWFSPILAPGTSYNLIELLHPLLIQFSDDAAKALSYFLGEEKTVELMNQKAKSLNMLNTEFLEPIGMINENVSTAQDLFNFARYLLNVHPRLLQITKGAKVPTFGLVIKFKNLENKNIFFNHPNFIGGKTSYINKQAGLFIFSFEIGEEIKRDIAIILLDSEDIEKDTLEILNWLQENYLLKEEETEEKMQEEIIFDKSPILLYANE